MYKLYFKTMSKNRYIGKRTKEKLNMCHPQKRLNKGKCKS